MVKVKNVQFVDAGLYECSLMNELGEARANASLTVGCKCYTILVRETVGVFFQFRNFTYLVTQI